MDYRPTKTVNFGLNTAKQTIAEVTILILIHPQTLRVPYYTIQHIIPNQTKTHALMATTRHAGHIPPSQIVATSWLHTTVVTLSI